MTTGVLSVLLVEDSADDGELMLLELLRAGYAPSAERVETAAAFRSALAARAWDVILCDNSLPMMNAQRSLDLLAESGQDVPLVIVSGTIGEERAVELMRAGATDFVMKGSLGRLAPAVEREVRQAAERRERRRAEGEARDLAAIVASSDDAIIGLTLDGVIRTFNGGAERLYGYPAADLIGKNVSLLVSPDRPDEKRDLIGRVARGERVEHYETEWVKKGGTRVHISVTLSPIQDDAGRVVGMSAIARDITDRRRAEDAVRASEERFRLFMDYSPATSDIKDEAGRFLYVNAAWRHQFGSQPVEDWEGKTNADFWPQETSELFRASDRACLDRNAAIQIEETFQNAAGEEMTKLVVKFPLLAGGRRLVGSMAWDITARKKAEDAVRLSEERYRTLIAATAAIVWNSPASGEFDSEQPGWTAFTGQTVEQHRGWGWLDAVHTDDRAETAHAWAAAIATQTIYQVQHRLRRADGEYRHMAVRAVPILDPGGAIREWVGVHTDITEQNRADAAIRESEVRYRSLADAMPQIVWATKPDGYHEFYNRQWYDYTGLTFGETEGEGWNHVFHPDDQPIAWDRWRHALATGDPYEIEYRCRRHDGEYRWFLGRALPQRDETGKIVRWFGTCTDIHDFKQAQTERYAALARLNLQVERMPLAYLLSGPDFRYTGWNPAAERTFGFTRSEVIGRHPFEVVVPPQSRSLVAEVFARLAAGDMHAHGACENVTKDGRVITCEWYNTPLFGPDGTFQGVLSLAQDITARRRAEHALLLRDRAIRAVVGGIVITDATAPDNPISYVSPGFEHLTGYTGAEAIGRNSRFLQGKDTDPAAVADLREAVRQGVPWDVELLNYLKDGTPFWNALSISPVRDDAGRLTNFIGVQTDVTGRRKLENQFHQAQKMDAVGRLAGGVAHDFNNLLTVINGYGDMVYDALPPGHPSRELVEEITKAGERAAGLTRQLLAFSRQSVLEPKVLEPNALVRDVETMLRRLIGEDIDLATRLAPDLGRVKADPGQLEQAVVNLCVNARDAMPQGGKLTVETRNIELDAAYVATHPDVRPGPYVVVAVSDTGTGMTPEVQARIFEPFFTTKEQGKGTGLGLAMVFGFVKQSGGHVGVHSEVGRGTTFKLYLPRVGDALLAGKSGVLRMPMPRGTETVLLVEDEDAVRALGRHVLVMCGYNVLEAGNGREAVRAADGYVGPLHLLLTDVVMPGGMGGRQVAEAVVARHPGAKVLFASGYTDDAVVRHGVLEAGTHFLQKPFTPAALAQKVRDVLDGKG